MYKSFLGQRFGRLTVFKESQDQRTGGVLRICVCDCGEEKAFQSQQFRDLRRGDILSCGCLKAEREKPVMDGTRFGRLTVLGDSGQRYNSQRLLACRCDCGKELLLKAYELKSKKHPSCGCLGREDLIGQKFGALRVIQVQPYVKKGKNLRRWLCLCDCGQEVLRHRVYLKNNPFPSCASCYYRRKALTPEQLKERRAERALRRQALLKKDRKPRVILTEAERKQRKKAQDRAKYLKNKEKYKAIYKAWRLKNKEKLREQQRVKRKNLSEEERARLKTKKAAWVRSKYKMDLNFRVGLLLRERLRRVVTRKRKNKIIPRKEQFSGCSLGELRDHISKQFKPGMTWDNYGKWHIDHIRPLASFDLSSPEEQRKACHFSNLQPLWAKENLTKSARWEDKFYHYGQT